MPYIFSGRGHRNTFFSVKVRRVISVIRGRLLKEAAQSVSAPAEHLRGQLSQLVLQQKGAAQSVSAPAEDPGREDFIRTIGAQLAEAISVKYIGSPLRGVKRCRRNSFLPPSNEVAGM